MRKVLFLFVLLGLITVLAFGQEEPSPLNIIPRPEKIKHLGGKVLFGLDYQVKMKDVHQDSIQRALASLEQYISKETPRHGRSTLTFKFDRRIVPEGYYLSTKGGNPTITASSSAGFFYGVQTLIQLLPRELKKVIKGKVFIPNIEIQDAPRFSYRGMHIDVSRHFFDIPFLKRQLDAMARYKINRFHWHFTDGAGWRMEINKYPNLTRYASHRPYKRWKDFWNNGRRYCISDAPAAKGGYYTQEEMRELIEYALQRHITIIPEIEMPGHSEEVLAVFPEFSCTGEPYECSEFCPGKEGTFEFLENILDETISLFPSKYIHIGGDEADKSKWKECPDCQRRMKEEGLKNVEELQSYFIKRIEKYLTSKGRKLLGWDEILEGGLAPEATVMSWRGEEGGIKAAKAGHHVIMTPGSHLYLDYYQDAPPSQPEAIGGYLPLSKVYAYDPIPEALRGEGEEMVLGVQANTWTEYIPTEEHFEYMVYPRIYALSEVAWTPKEQKNFKDFHRRALMEVQWMKSMGYHPFDLSKEIGERPESRKPIHHLAKGKTVTYTYPYSEQYKAQGDHTLVDGQRGGWAHGDSRWQGTMNPLEVLIDLEREMQISSIEAIFMQADGAWIWFPSEVTISTSIDGKRFQPLTHKKCTIPTNKEGLLFENFGWSGKAVARYIKYSAKQSGKAGGWLFLDEIIVR